MRMPSARRGERMLEVLTAVAILRWLLLLDSPMRYTNCRKTWHGAGYGCNTTVRNKSIAVTGNSLQRVRSSTHNIDARYNIEWSCSTRKICTESTVVEYDRRQLLLETQRASKCSRGLLWCLHRPVRKADTVAATSSPHRMYQSMLQAPQRAIRTIYGPSLLFCVYKMALIRHGTTAPHNPLSTNQQELWHGLSRRATNRGSNTRVGCKRLCMP